ncbi:DUF3135 domain-containing protein [Marinicellulosiphila megalodicopiae]|uniref:DUF3135 domain-containing protein n=1 Tax=Marinicellulosiphila megalodicopiae TaxID=2724896 RepID=UPI003BAFE447
MQRDLPDFDTLMAMAKDAPEQLEALRKSMIDEVISDASPKHQPRLKGLQFTLDMEIQRAPNSLISCMKISKMMHNSMNRLRTFFDENGEIQDSRDISTSRADIICFENSKGKLRA